MPLLPRFTDAGKALQLRALDGEEIKFTKIQMGSGNLGETSYKTFNALLEPKVTIPITDISVSNGYAAIRGYFNNEKLTEGFYYRELGLFAKDPDDDTKEILYCYGNSGEKAGFIAEPSSKLIERSIKIIAVVDDAENVSAIINGSAVYVDFTDMRKAIEDHNSDPNAHPLMLSQRLTVYIDCTSTEEDALCDGSYDHPYKSFHDIEYAIPEHIKSLDIILKKSGDYFLIYEIYFGGPNLENISISYNGSATNRPKIHGSFSFGALKNVRISSVDFVWAGETFIAMSYKMLFDSCESVWISNVYAQSKKTEFCGLVDCYNSRLYISNLNVSNMDYAINAYSLSVVHFLSGSVDTSGESITCENSTVYLYADIGATCAYSEGSLIFTPDIMEKITNGSLIDHMKNTENPHHVSLEQAQKNGGLIDVAHGGTGQKTLLKGSLLKGNGTDAVGMLKGTGVLCSLEDGNPFFGTVPVAYGGTGMTSATNGNLIMGGGLNNSMKELGKAAGALFCNGAEHHYGILPQNMGGTGQGNIHYDYYDEGATYYKARHVQFVVPGTNILVWSGRIIVESGNTFDCQLSWSGNKTFADSSYALILSNADISESEVTRYANHFHVDSQLIGDRVTDFLAIGKVAT